MTPGNAEKYQARQEGKSAGLKSRKRKISLDIYRRIGYTSTMSIQGFRFPDKPIETTPEVVGSLPENEWIAQEKYDGWRMESYFDGPGHVRCLTRVGRPMEQTRSSFKSEVGDRIKSMGLPAGTVLDAEFVGPRGHQDPAVYIFDMLAWEGGWLVKEPYEQRWERCKSLTLPQGPIYLAETVEDDFIAFFERLKAGWDRASISLCEGIVVKSRKGKLKLDRNSSKKSDTQLKLKYRDIKSSRF